jgi:DNA-binding beta-propeller fold protein YncE
MMANRAKSFLTVIVRLALVFLLGAMVLTSGSRGYPSASAADEPSLPDLNYLKEFDDNVCLMPKAIPERELNQASDDQVSGIIGGDVPPVRSVVDPYPSFNGIAIDTINNQVAMSDTNGKGLLLYDRVSGSRSLGETRPLRQITGPNTALGFIAGVALDSERREIYGVNNDIEDNLAVFSYDDEGDLKPKRKLIIPHGAWGVALSPSRDEVALSVQYGHAVVIYRRGAIGGEAPSRGIRGPSTGMADPHGIAWDQTNKEIVVANQGNKNSEPPPHTDLRKTGPGDAPSSTQKDPNSNQSLGGEFFPPSITFYSEASQGDAKPLRAIQGPRTRLATPMGLDVDPDNDEIAVANNGENSILIFRRSANGNVAPVRVLKGPRTGIDHPMGVVIDRKNNELWVANFGNHSAVVFDRAAVGNVAPKRIIRNAPAGTPTSGFGNPMAAAYDTKRQEILVPN